MLARGEDGSRTLGGTILVKYETASSRACLTLDGAFKEGVPKFARDDKS